jgi:ABC-2 type transport system ATP-binding protein
MSGVSVEGVTFRYGHGPEVLKALSLEVQPGEILGLLGPNGAGKTTLFRLIAGLLRPCRGSIQVAGFSLTSERREASRRLGFVPDEPLLYPMLSALENLNMYALLWGVPAEVAKARAESLLHDVGLWEERHAWVRTYSRGMRQRLALAGAVLHEPEVLVLDEPFNGLDLGAGLWCRESLRRQAAAGRAILLSSHEPETLGLLADRLAVLRQGRIAALLGRTEMAAEGGVAAVYLRLCGAVRAMGEVLVEIT